MVNRHAFVYNFYNLLLFLKNRALGVPWIIQSLLYILVGLFGLSMYKWNLSGLVFALPVLSYVVFGWLYFTSLLNMKISFIWVGAQLLFFAFFHLYLLFGVDDDAFLILLPLVFSLLNFWAFYWMNKKISFLRF